MSHLPEIRGSLILVENPVELTVGASAVEYGEMKFERYLSRSTSAILGRPWTVHGTAVR